jgi:hypothetical protein
MTNLLIAAVLLLAARRLRRARPMTAREVAELRWRR